MCLRYSKEFQLGSFTNPDPVLRRKAIDLTLEAGEWAREIGATEIVVWSAFDGTPEAPPSHTSPRRPTPDVLIILA